MPRYWVIAPVESHPADVFDKIWQFDLANNLISIGWHQLGDVSTMSKEELFDAVDTTYPGKPPGAKGLITNMIWKFYHEIRPGDFLLARRGLKTLVAIGKVASEAFYSPGKNPENSHENYLQVEWLQEPRNKRFDDLTFNMITLYEIEQQRFQDLVSGPATVLPAVVDAVEDAPIFVLEKYLEDFIVTNFETIFEQQLRVFEDKATGAYGQQFQTSIGRIDILAIDDRSKDFLVFELKKGQSSDQVVGQILRYMGWVKLNLCKEGQSVRGIIVCSDEDSKLRYALEMCNNIEVRFYSVSFKLSEKPC